MSWQETKQDTTTPPATPELPKRPTWTSLRCGFFGRCPACGRGRLFRAFLKVADQCPACGEALHHHQADDAPAYFVILIVGHLVVPLALLVEIAWSPPYWLHAAIWLPLTAGLAVGLLTPIKGAIVGWQWANYMHGFDPNAETEANAADADHRGP
jgi:uncharacterized protein (DUF983 family)